MYQEVAPLSLSLFLSFSHRFQAEASLKLRFVINADRFYTAANEQSNQSTVFPVILRLFVVFVEMTVSFFSVF